MEFGFTTDQETLRAAVREVLTARSTGAAVRDASAGDGIDRALWATIGELGWAGVAIDESLGGLGLGLLELAIISEELGRAIAPVPFFSTVGLSVQLLEQIAPSAARDDLLRSIAGEGTIVTVAGGLTDAPSVVADGDTVTGDAGLVLDAHLADRLLVPAMRDGRIAIFVVDAPAAVAEQSLDGTRRLGRVVFDQTAATLLDDDAELALSRALDRSAVLLAAEGVGVCQEVLDRTVVHARERTQFDRAIGSYQAISHRCADMMLLTETARSHVYYAAWALEEGATDGRIAAASSKAAAADAARFVGNGGIQIHGGIGFTWEHDMHLFYRRAKFCELFLGDAGVWRERIAAALVG